MRSFSIFLWSFVQLERSNQYKLYCITRSITAIIDYFYFFYYCRFYRGLYAHEVWGHVGHVQRCGSRDLWSKIDKNSQKYKFQTAADARRANASMIDRIGLDNYKTQKKSVLFGFLWTFWHLKVGSLWPKRQTSTLTENTHITPA